MHYLITFLVAMVPLIELRGAVPLVLGMLLKETGQMPSFPQILTVLAIAVVGNMLPVPFIFFFARRVLEWGQDKPIIGDFFTWCLKKGHSGGEKLKAVAGERGTFFALLIFVGIPVPGTGAWTGTLAASILDWDFKRSVITVMLGVMMAGIIMVTLTLILGQGFLIH